MPSGNLQVKLVKCLVDNIVVDISFQSLGGLCTVNFLESIDRRIDDHHLFKRSIILVGSLLFELNADLSCIVLKQCTSLCVASTFLPSLGKSTINWGKWLIFMSDSLGQ